MRIHKALALLPDLFSPYLDYLLLDEATKKDFKFQIRTSIQHFYPQHPEQTAVRC